MARPVEVFGLAFHPEELFSSFFPPYRQHGECAATRVSPLHLSILVRLVLVTRTRDSLIYHEKKRRVCS